MMDVMLNLRCWNQELATPEGRALWGRRTITYFVFDPRSGGFAPSKFCAYLAIQTVTGLRLELGRPPATAQMKISLYVTLDGTDSTFDGGRARTHLIRSLAMIPKTLSDMPKMEPLFERWLAQHCNYITVHPSGPIFLLPPPWFR